MIKISSNSTNTSELILRLQSRKLNKIDISKKKLNFEKRLGFKSVITPFINHFKNRFKLTLRDRIEQNFLFLNFVLPQKKQEYLSLKKSYNSPIRYISKDVLKLVVKNLYITQELVKENPLLQKLIEVRAELIYKEKVHLQHEKIESILLKEIKEAKKLQKSELESKVNYYTILNKTLEEMIDNSTVNNSKTIIEKSSGDIINKLSSLTMNKNVINKVEMFEDSIKLPMQLNLTTLLKRDSKSAQTFIQMYKKIEKLKIENRFTEVKNIERHFIEKLKIKNKHTEVTNSLLSGTNIDSTSASIGMLNVLVKSMNTTGSPVNIDMYKSTKRTYNENYILKNIIKSSNFKNLVFNYNHFSKIINMNSSETTIHKAIFQNSWNNITMSEIDNTIINKTGVNRSVANRSIIESLALPMQLRLTTLIKNDSKSSKLFSQMYTTIEKLKRENRYIELETELQNFENFIVDKIGSFGLTQRSGSSSLINGSTDFTNSSRALKTNVFKEITSNRLKSFISRSTVLKSFFSLSTLSVGKNIYSNSVSSSEVIKSNLVSHSRVEKETLHQVIRYSKNARSLVENFYEEFISIYPEHIVAKSLIAKFEKDILKILSIEGLSEAQKLEELEALKAKFFQTVMLNQTLETQTTTVENIHSQLYKASLKAMKKNKTVLTLHQHKILHHGVSDVLRSVDATQGSIQMEYLVQNVINNVSNKERKTTQLILDLSSNTIYSKIKAIYEKNLTSHNKELALKTLSVMVHDHLVDPQTHAFISSEKSTLIKEKIEKLVENNYQANKGYENDKKTFTKKIIILKNELKEAGIIIKSFEKETNKTILNKSNTDRQINNNIEGTTVSEKEISIESLIENKFFDVIKQKNKEKLIQTFRDVLMKGTTESISTLQKNEIISGIENNISSFNTLTIEDIEVIVNNNKYLLKQKNMINLKETSNKIYTQIIEKEGKKDIFKTEYSTNNSLIILKNDIEKAVIKYSDSPQLLDHEIQKIKTVYFEKSYHDNNISILKMISNKFDNKKINLHQITENRSDSNFITNLYKSVLLEIKEQHPYVTTTFLDRKNIYQKLQKVKHNPQKLEIAYKEIKEEFVKLSKNKGVSDNKDVSDNKSVILNKIITNNSLFTKNITSTQNKTLENILLSSLISPKSIKALNTKNSKKNINNINIVKNNISNVNMLDGENSFSVDNINSLIGPSRTKSVVVSKKTFDIEVKKEVDNILIGSAEAIKNKKEEDKKTVDTQVDEILDAKSSRLSENIKKEKTGMYQDLDDKLDELALKIFREIKDEMNIGYKRL